MGMVAAVAAAEEADADTTTSRHQSWEVPWVKELKADHTDVRSAICRRVYPRMRLRDYYSLFVSPVDSTREGDIRGTRTGLHMCTQVQC